MILGTICMRGGSKGVKGKNIRMLLGKPLMHYTIDCAKQSKLIDEIVVSSDSEAILREAEKSGIKKVFSRSSELATDKASKWEVFRDIVLRYEEETAKHVEYLVDLDVTVPRRLPEHIDGAIKLMQKKQAEVVITAYEPERNPYFNMMEEDADGWAKLVKQGETPIVCRQQAPTVYSLTPAVYVVSRNTLFEVEHWSKAKCALYPIPRERAVDIDTKLDFKLVEFLMKEDER